MRERLRDDGAVVLCGVSTDCCVLMTALAAVDDGATYASSPMPARPRRRTHMPARWTDGGARAQLRIVTTEEELAAMEHASRA